MDAFHQPSNTAVEGVGDGNVFLLPAPARQRPPIAASSSSSSSSLAAALPLPLRYGQSQLVLSVVQQQQD